MKNKENSTEPLIKSAISLPLPNLDKTKTMFGISDEDVDVCLNCTLPPNKCRGHVNCYNKQKRVGGKSKK